MISLSLSTMLNNEHFIELSSMQITIFFALRSDISFTNNFLPDIIVDIVVMQLWDVIGSLNGNYAIEIAHCRRLM